ncbi:MAG: methyltransferase domain-containing protein [Candidatus Pacebacteria bacterium]|nr:methyltransferase domain-containing protein [Candidatus Paceibacterota bacterium]
MNLKKIYRLVKSKFLPLLYFGFKYKCPYCNRSFRKFLSAGINKRPNAKCPSCSSLERHRLLWLYLKNKTNFFKDNIKVLDIAPTLFFHKMCKSFHNIDYTSMDISSPLAIIKMDITDIKLPDEQFDCIICYHVLEHIIDDKKAIEELYRVLKFGGWAIIQSPIDIKRKETFEDNKIINYKDREKMFGQGDHVRIYGTDYKLKLENVGFKVRVDRYSKNLSNNVSEKFGLLKNEDIYYCTK